MKLVFPNVEFDDGNSYTGVFELGEDGVVGTEESPGRLEEGVDTGTLDPQGLNATLAVIDRVAGTNIRDGERITVSLQNTLTWELEFISPSDALTKSDGSLFQWGSSTQQTVAPHTATGADRRTQVAVLNNYILRSGGGDLFTQATLHAYPRSEDGPFDPVDVSIRGPSGSITTATTATADVAMELISAADISEAVDAVDRQA